MEEIMAKKIKFVMITIIISVPKQMIIMWVIFGYEKN